MLIDPVRGVLARYRLFGISAEVRRIAKVHLGQSTVRGPYEAAPFTPMIVARRHRRPAA